MALHADSIIDRINLKAQITRWRLLAIVIAILAVISFYEQNSHLGPIGGSYIARIRIEGVISDNRELAEALEDVRDDRFAKAVIIWLNTPGGSAVGGQELYYNIRDIATKKPVVIVMRSLAASAGYMAALAGDHLVAREGTITGSIGVILEGAEFTELAKKIGVQPIVIKTGEFKASPSPLEKLTPRQEEALQVSINDFFIWFKKLVSDRRKIPMNTVNELANGRIFSGKQALDSHLIDELGGEREALAWLQKSRNISPSLDIRDIKGRKEDKDGLFDDIAHGVFSSFSRASARQSEGLTSIWNPNAL